MGETCHWGMAITLGRSSGYYPYLINGFRHRTFLALGAAGKDWVLIPPDRDVIMICDRNIVLDEIYDRINTCSIIDSWFKEMVTFQHESEMITWLRENLSRHEDDKS